MRIDWGSRLIGRMARKYRTVRQMTWHGRSAWAWYHFRYYLWYPAGRVVGRPGYTVWPLAGLVLAAAGFRFLPFDVARKGGFGNLLHLPAYYLQAIGVGFKPRRRWIILAPSRQVANFAVLDYWRRHFFVIQSDWLCYLLAPLTWTPVVSDGQAYFWPHWRMKKDGRLLRERQASHEVTRQYEEKYGTTKVLELSPEHESAGWKNLSRFSVPRDAWWVVIHAREAGSVNDPLHLDSDSTCRNGDIRTYRAAVEHIIGRGGWVIRVGDPGMSHFPKMERVIDYVHTDMFCDWMDLFLSARCRFMLGTSSGANLLPWVFGRPVAMVNYASAGQDPDPDSSLALYISKLQWSEREDRLLSFVEVQRSPLKQCYSDRVYASHGVHLVDNTPEEILELTKEMFEVIDGKAVYTAQDEHRQRRFVELRNEGKPYPSPTLTRVGREFLRKYDRSLH